MGKESEKRGEEKGEEKGKRERGRKGFTAQAQLGQLGLPTGTQSDVSPPTSRAVLESWPKQQKVS